MKLGKGYIQIAGFIGLLFIATFFLIKQEGALVGAASGKKIKKSFSLATLDGIDPKGPRLVQLGTASIEDLLSALESRGAKVETKLVEAEGLQLLEIKVDGQKLAPAIANCNDCEPIVYEY